MPNGGSKSGAKSSGSSEGMASLSRKIPADISDEERAFVRETAVKAFKALGCNGVSRIDFMMDSLTREIWINEINTIPGSLSFYLWEPMGVKYPELLDRMIAWPSSASGKKAEIHYDFDTKILEGRLFRRHERQQVVIFGEKNLCRNLKTGAGAKIAEKRAKIKKFRIKPFLKGLREWKGQSPFPSAHFPYFRSWPQLCRL